MTKINLKVKDKSRLQEVRDYINNSISIWNSFPVALNTQSHTHTFLEFYEQVDDLMKVVCEIFYNKKYTSYTTRKEKIEKILGNYISKDVETLLSCRRILAHEVVKTRQNEDILVGDILNKAKIGIASMNKDILDEEIESNCWLILYNFNIELSEKLIHYNVKNIISMINMSDGLSESVLANYLIELNKPYFEIIYRSRVSYVKKIKKIEEEVLKGITVTIS